MAEEEDKELFLQELNLSRQESEQKEMEGVDNAKVNQDGFKLEYIYVPVEESDGDLDEANYDGGDNQDVDDIECLGSVEEQNGDSDSSNEATKDKEDCDSDIEEVASDCDEESPFQFLPVETEMAEEVDEGEGQAADFFGSMFGLTELFMPTKKARIEKRPPELPQRRTRSSRLGEDYEELVYDKPKPSQRMNTSSRLQPKPSSSSMESPATSKPSSETESLVPKKPSTPRRNWKKRKSSETKRKEIRRQRQLERQQMTEEEREDFLKRQREQRRRSRNRIYDMLERLEKEEQPLSPANEKKKEKLLQMLEEQLRKQREQKQMRRARMSKAEKAEEQRRDKERLLKRRAVHKNQIGKSSKSGAVMSNEVIEVIDLD